MKLSLIFVILGVFLLCCEAHRYRYRGWGYHGRRGRWCQKRIRCLKVEIARKQNELDQCLSPPTTTTTTTTPTTTTPLPDCPDLFRHECRSRDTCDETNSDEILDQYGCPNQGDVCCKVD
ncbi:uncharacterized protein LOC121387471 [Gigantopelta aegis]|uniref:uncharacterized protein LOC121387471 n=1 Tax=Gigantopelta aegis TaxID=1735272 RepID=UPI001B88DA67|nr:uncharacterized protein LOC121387471 [Gigantopelta aegis]